MFFMQQRKAVFEKKLIYEFQSKLTFYYTRRIRRECNEFAVHISAL